MEFRGKETARAALALSLLLSPGALFGQEFRYQVRHQQLPKGATGTLTINSQGVSFQEAAKKGSSAKHTWSWTFEDIQQIEIAPRLLRVLTYKDSRWKLGADSGFQFALTSDGSFRDAYEFLKTRLDQRLVAALPDNEVKAIWEVPVKHLLRFGGDQGVLAFGEDRIVYASDKKNESRTWRYADIDSISSSGPFQLTITSYERALVHYGNLKGFNFQLKRPLREDQYDRLWQRVNESKGLKFISSYRERKP